MEQKIKATWIIHSEDPFVLMHPALSRFLYPHEPITEDLKDFLSTSYNLYQDARKDISRLINEGILEIIPAPTNEDIIRSIKEYKNTVDIYIKIKEDKFKSLGFIIYDH